MQERNAIDEYYDFKKKYLEKDIINKNKKIDEFSEGESNIIRLLAQNYSVKYISQLLKTSYNSINVQICSINKKILKKIKINPMYRKEYQLIEYMKGLCNG